jgi:DNA-binding MarR family transcriptional regulator
MQRDEVDERIRGNWGRKQVLAAITQPMTARQLARRIGIDRDSCSEILSDLAELAMVRCLNPLARRSRLYWLTTTSLKTWREVDATEGRPSQLANIPRGVDWSLYGWICYSHRAAIVKALARSMQPAEIKRRARWDNQELRMSANNVRDAIRLMLAKGVVRAVRIRSERHPQYELTEVGRQLRELLLSAC